MGLLKDAGLPDVFWDEPARTQICNRVTAPHRVMTR